MGAELKDSVAMSFDASQSDFLFKEPIAGFIIVLLLTFPAAVLSWAMLHRACARATAWAFPAKPCLAPTSCTGMCGGL